METLLFVAKSMEDKSTVAMLEQRREELRRRPPRDGARAAVDGLGGRAGDDSVGLAGESIHALHDFRQDVGRATSDELGVNYKGLFARDRSPKGDGAAEAVAARYEAQALEARRPLVR